LKPLKVVKTVLRFWIGLTATGSFLAGWALLAHAPKPVQTNPTGASVASLITAMTPLPPLDISVTAGGSGNQPPIFRVQRQPPLLAAGPVLRTGGS
jgi:hypothetical protein